MMEPDRFPACSQPAPAGGQGETTNSKVGVTGATLTFTPWTVSLTAP